MKKCLVIGATMLDIVANLDSLPVRGGDAYIKQQEMMLGGCAYNVASILKHFNIPNTLFAPIGSGMYASFIENKLKEEGYSSPIKSIDMDNGYSMCIVEADGERTFITLSGIECYFRKEWFDSLDINLYDKVYISGYELEGEGGNVILDFLEDNKDLEIYYAPGPRINYISEDRHKRLFKLSPIIHLNEKEIIEYTKESGYKEATNTLRNLTNNTVILTLGDKGAYYSSREKEGFIPSKASRVLDTIGAGDSHIGTIIACLSKDKNLEFAIEQANKIAAKVVSVKGSTLTKKEFEEGRL